MFNVNKIYEVVVGEMFINRESEIGKPNSYSGQVCSLFINALGKRYISFLLIGN